MTRTDLTPQPGRPVAIAVRPGPGAAAWATVLEQAGWSHAEQGWRDAPVAVTTGSVSRDERDWVEAGGALVVDAAVGGDGVLPTPARRVTVSGFEDPDGRRVVLPGSVAVFPGDGVGLLRVHEDRVVKHGLDQGRYALVHRVRLGRGQVLFTGARLTEGLISHGDRLREVADWSPVTERMASVDKAGIAETLAWMVTDAAGLVGLPVVRRAAWPEGARSVFVLRVDVDGVYGERARRIGDVARELGVRATFFLNRELSEAYPGDLGRWLDDHDVGQHADTHDLYDEPSADLHNLSAGEAWVRATTGRDPVGFVAPRGLWSPSLDEAIAALGHRWSSDFGLATDGRPFWPVGPVLQVPVHAYSPERAARWATEQGHPPPSATAIRDHYLRHLEEQVARERPVHVYGHPEVLGAVAEQVLPPLVARVRALGLPVMTLDELARHWEARRRSTVAARVTVDAAGEPLLCIHRTGPATAVDVVLPRPMAVALDGEPQGVRSGQLTLQ